MVNHADTGISDVGIQVRGSDDRNEHVQDAEYCS